MNYYIAACVYIVYKFPVNDPCLVHAAVANVNKLKESKFISIEFFPEQFPCFLKAEMGQSENEVVDFLKNQFCILQIYSVVPDLDK